MLARASSDAGTRLRRSKSTSTVHRRPPSISEPPHPGFVQQQALAAATAAYARAQAQDEADRNAKRSSDFLRSKSNSSRKSLTSQGSHFPPRESGFRAVQAQKTAPVASISRQTKAATIDTDQFPPFFPLPVNDRPMSAPRPLSAQPSIAFSEHTRPGSQGKPQRQSASSSVTSQQIRKARSMYYASSVQTGSPIARPPAKYLTSPPSTDPSPAADTPSVSLPSRPFPRSPLVAPRIPITVAADETLDQARDKYLQGFKQKTTKHKPFVFLAPFKKRQDKGLEKPRSISSLDHTASVRDQQFPSHITKNSALVDDQTCHELKEKRSLSGSLKSKFKRVFRRTSYRSPTLPIQQIDASRDYFSSINTGPSNLNHACDIPSPDELTLQRVRSRTPSLEAVQLAVPKTGSRTSSNESSKSNKSGRSLRSELNTTHCSSSRVTSWGTSSSGDTLTQRAIKRLTVIHEAKDSIGSEADRIASMVPRRKSLPPLAAFRDPMPMESLVEESTTPVDPKRVFSALMKEIHESNTTQESSYSVRRTPGDESDVFESSATKILYSQPRDILSSIEPDFRPSVNGDQRPTFRRPESAAAHSAQSKNSTTRSIGRAIRSTIRAVSPTEPHSKSATSEEFNLYGHPRGASTPINTTPESGMSESQRAPLVFTPSAAQIESRIAKDNGRWKTPLDDFENVQFPRQTDRTYNVTNFAQQTTHLTTDTRSSDQGESSECNAPKLTTKSETRPHESPKVPVSPAPRPVMSPLSPSIYSRNTDGYSILPNDSVFSLDTPNACDRPQDSGSAVIITSQSVRSYVIGTPSPRRPESTRDSRDWKAWLSHEISGMECLSQEDLKIHEQYATPTGRHRRESAHTEHTEHDDTTVILRESSEVITPRLDIKTPTVAGAVKPIASEKAQSGARQTGSKPWQADLVMERSQSHPDAFKEVSPVLARLTTMSIEPITSPPASSSNSIQSGKRVSLTPKLHAITSQHALETRKSTRMNDRFPHINRSRRSSNNSAASSRHSKSPTDSVVSRKSSKSTESSKAIPNTHIYSDTSASASNEPIQNFQAVCLRSSHVKSRRKENVSPVLTRTNSTSVEKGMSAPSRPLSMQTCSSSALTPNQASASQHTQYNANGAATPPRVRVRASLRPISPEKLARRPRSAFDLRSVKTSNGPQALYRTNIAEFKTPSSQPAPELLRPAIGVKTSSSSLAQAKEPSPITEERVIDSVLDGQREGSITPGQRMADRFLNERKSTGVLLSGKMRGGLKLTREDTPAFL